MNVKKPLSILSVLLTAVLVFGNIVVLNLLCRKVDQRWDLTEDKRYELGEGTSNILSRLDDTVSVKAYVSSNLPKRYAPLERLLIEKLQEYEKEAGGKLIFEFVDPDIDKSAKQECDDLGIQPARLNEFERTTSQVVTSYMAIVFRYGDRKKVVNFFIDLRTSLDDQNRFVSDLEYHLTRGIQSISTDRKTVAILANTQMVPSDPRNPKSEKRPYQGLTNIKATLERSFDVLELDIKEVNRGVNLPENLDAMLVHGIPETTEVGRYIIDQFIIGGGNVLFMVDAGAVDSQPKPKATVIGKQRVRDFDLPTFKAVVINHGLNPWLEHFGLRLEADFILDSSAFETVYIKDRQLKRNILNQVVVQPVTDNGPYFNWVKVPARGEDGALLSEKQVAPDQLIFPPRDTVVFTSASPLTLLEDRLKAQGAKSTVLIRSGPGSWTRPIKGESFSPDPKQQMLTPGEGMFPIMVMLSGKFSSYYKGKDVPAVLGANGEPLPVPQERKDCRRDDAAEEGTILFLGDADCAHDRMLQGIMQIEAEVNKVGSRLLAQKKATSMVKLVSNSMDLLCFGGEAGDLFEVKNKLLVRSRAIKSVEDHPDDKSLIDLVVFFLIPGFVVALGILRWIFRRVTAVAS
ncbi:MAG: Gldg family protein [Planctomycetota bacterium]